MLAQLSFYQSLVFVLLLSGCASKPMLEQHNAASPSKTCLFYEMGGEAVAEKITLEFIQQISMSKQIVPYFENSNIDRFEAKFYEHLCFVTNGPCEYTGDSMEQVHAGMDITETHFNRLVELLINAMTEADVPHPTQNKILARFVPMRKEIIYK